MRTWHIDAGTVRKDTLITNPLSRGCVMNSRFAVCIVCVANNGFPMGVTPFASSISSLKPLRRSEFAITIIFSIPAGAAILRNKEKSPLNPRTAALAEHLLVEDDGTISGLTVQGRALILACRLDRPKLVIFRRNQMELLKLLQKYREARPALLLKYYFGFPLNLPDLSSLRPPDGNARPKGIDNCYFELRKRGELPDVYEV